MSESEYVYNRMGINLFQHPHGQYLILTPEGPGGYPWRKDLPMRPDSREALRWPIAGCYGRSPLRLQLLYFFEGRFRSSQGNIQSTPLQWMYYRFPGDEVWDVASNQFLLDQSAGAIPPFEVPPVPKACQDAMDAILKNFPISVAKNALDASIYGIPDTGAPEP